MGTRKLGDSMSEDIREIIANGVDSNVVCSLASQNLNKDYFPKQAADYFELLCDISSGNSYTPFIDKLRVLFQNGLAPEQIQTYLNSNINIMSAERINFVMKSLACTTAYQKKLQAKENDKYTTGKQYQYLKDQTHN